MPKKNSSLFSDLVKDTQEATIESKPKKARHSYLDERKTNINNIVDNNREEKTLLWVEPDVCKMWPNHNRRYDLLSEERCRDLIDGIRSQGKQEFPAIVRSINNDQYQYEVICGARRHWAITYLRNHNYKNFKFLIEVRDIDDEEAFRLSDIENRDREDISDYERALDYFNASQLYYSTQVDMARRLEMSESYLSRYLDLAKLPKEIVKIFSSVTELKCFHARELKPFLKDPEIRQKLLDKALSLQESQSERIKNGTNPWTDNEMYRQLKNFNNEETKQPDIKRTYSLPGTKTSFLQIKKKSNGQLNLTLKPIKDEDKGKAKALLMKALEEMI